MKFEQYTHFACSEWDKAMRETEHFSLEKCTTDEKEAVWDRISESYDLGISSDERRVVLAIERLEKLGAFREDTVALDIGSGTGAYTLALARKCKTVYALDSSPGMQEILRRKAQRNALTNIISIQSDWRTVRPNELPGRFDIVLSSLNTGINDFDSLVKMNSVSCGYCCYITPHGNTAHSSRADFQRILFGRTLHTAGGNDIIHAFNIIYGLGYRPELTYAPCEWARTQTPAEALEAVCSDFSRYGPIDKSKKAPLDDYIQAHLNEDGYFSQSQKSTVGIMIWDTNIVPE